MGMRLIFLYGQAAAGKLTVARALAARTGFVLFHNHLIVDAVGAVFPFGSDSFVRLREAFWIGTMESAAREGRSLIFTFAPEPTVAPDFPMRLADRIEALGGETLFVALRIDPETQERRIGNGDRSAFGKLTSVAMLRDLRKDFDRCMAAMPVPAITIDTAITGPEHAADRIMALLSE
jgi:hypothetical protein